MIQAVNDLKSHLALRIAHFTALKKNPDLKAGVPQLPAYLDKNDRHGFVLNASNISGKGRFPAINSKKHTLRHSFNGGLLSELKIEAWNQFDFDAFMQKSLAKVKQLAGNDVEVQFVQLRCVPETKTCRGRRRHGVKWELIFKQTRILKDTSLLAQAIQAHNQTAKKPFEKLSDSDKNNVLASFVSNYSGTMVAAGVDPGIINHVTLATTTGLHIVYSGKRQNAKWTQLNQSLDNRKRTIFQAHLDPG